MYLSIVVFVFWVGVCVQVTPTLNHDNDDNLLLLGDSVDRETVLEWCRLHGFDKEGSRNRPVQYVFGNGSIAYSYKSKGRFASLVCKIGRINPSTPPASTAFVHIFGSSSFGPYSNSLQSSRDDPYVDSLPRLHMAMALYFERVGKPKRIIFHTAQWDIQQVYMYHGEIYPSSYKGKGVKSGRLSTTSSSSTPPDMFKYSAMNFGMKVYKISQKIHTNDSLKYGPSWRRMVMRKMSTSV